MRQLRLLLVSILCLANTFLIAQDNDCATTSIEICDDTSINFTPNGSGIDDFAPVGNDDGCLNGEHFSIWIEFSFNSLTPAGSLIEFTISPTSSADYDFAVFGPNYDCNALGSPVACSYAAGSTLTGVGMGATDPTEGAGGDGFVAPITVNPNETFIMIVDNFSSNGVGFDLTWGGSAAPFLQCCPLDVDAGPDVMVCDGDPAFNLSGLSFGNNGPVTYSWTATNGGDAYLDDPTSPTPQVSIPPGVTGTFVYTLTATDLDCTESSSMTVTVNPNPTTSISSSAAGICPGSSVTLTANGVFSSYSWTTGDTGSSITVNAGGTYGVVVTDGNGCTASASIVVPTFTSPSVDISGNTTICTGSTATLDAGGPYASYLWNTNETTQTITVLAPGTYIVTVTDNNGCFGVDQVDVVTQADLMPTITGNLSICPGSTTVLDAGGPYSTYIWSTGDMTQTITVSAEGTYSVTVSDGVCDGETSVNVVEDTPPTANISGNLGYCQGGMTTLSADPGFTYMWSTGEMTQTINVSAPGNYGLTITNAGGCSGSTSVNVSEFPAPMPNITGNLSFCPGGNTTLDAGPGYSNYAWSTGEGTQTITVSSAGSYEVTVTDANNCTGISMVNVVESPPPTVNISGPTDICANESATLTADPGFVTYSWSTSDMGQSITVNGSGTYSVTATDANGCTAQASITISQSPDLTPSITGDLSFCTGSSATLDAGAGYANYSWSDGQSAQVISVSTPGVISVTVSDAVGCSGTTSVNIIENIPPTPGITGNLQFCTGNSTQLTADPGFASYAWSNGQSGQAIIVTSGGNYEVTVTDNNNCTGVASVFVTENPLPVPNITGNLSFCTGQSTTLDAGGGFQSYQWSNGTSSQFNTVTAGGNYTVTVTDANGCQGETSTFVTENPLPNPFISGSPFICPGESSLLDAGVGYQNYQWSTGEFSQNIEVFASGVYEVTVTDFNGCQGTTQFQVTELPPVFVQIDGDSELCQGQDGLLDAGVGYQSYEWSTGEFGQLLVISNPGLYTVTVTDANGCQGETSTFVTLSDSPDNTITGVLEICPGTPTTLTAPSGPYFYQWSTNEVTQSIQVDQPGTYEVIITSNSGCSSVGEVTVTAQSDPSPTITGNLTFCDGGSSVLDAGTGFATYLWSDGSDTQTLTVDSTGDYSVTVTTFDGCTGEGMVSVTENTLPTVDIQGDPNICAGTNTTLDAGAGFATYLWSDGTTDATLDVSATGTYSVTVTDANGCEGIDQFVLTVDDNPEPQISGSLSFCPGSSTTLDGGSFVSYLWSTGEITPTIIVDTPDDYSLTVTDANGCEGITTVQVEEQTELSPIISGDLNYCAGGNTVLDAGTGFDTYLWSNGETTQELTVTAPGDYSVTVTDLGGCSGETTVNVIENPLPTISIAGLADICEGETSTLDPGAGFATYLWSDGSNNPTLDVTTTGTYGVTITDANGCEAEASIDVLVTTNPEPQISGSLSYCTDGSTTLDAGDGYSTYLWSDGSTEQTLSVATPGDVSVTVTNANGCSGEVLVNVQELPELSPLITGVLEFCVGDSTLLDAGPGFTSYLWSDMSVGQQLMVSAPGDYSVTVMDASGCEGNTMVTVLENALPSVSIMGDAAICEGNMTTLDAGTFQSYNWSNAANTPTIDVTTANNYSVTVTDVNGCEGIGDFEVSVNELPQPMIIGDPSFCQGTNTMLAADQSYSSYAWSSGEDTQSVTVTTAGGIDLVVVDSNGCEGNATAFVNELPLPTVNIGGDNAFCAGTETTLDAGAGFNTYLWSDNSSAQQLTVDSAGMYSVEVTDANGCSETASIDITENPLPTVNIDGDDAFCAGTNTTLDAGTGFNTYLWSDGSDLQTLEVNQSGTYTVEVTDANSCTNTAQLVVNENALPEPQIAGSLSFCPGTETTLDAGSGFVSYNWTGGIADQTINVNIAGTYDLTVTDANGCEGVTSVDVSEDADLSPVIAGDLSFCVGTNTTLDAGVGFDTYTWSDMSNGQTLEVTQPGDYSVTVTNGGCSGEATVSVSEDALPIPTISGLSMICEDAMTTISVNETFESYTWSDSTNNASLDVAPGSYSVQVTDINGCIGEATFDVSPISLPVPQFSGVAAICNGGSTNISTVENYVNYSWSTGSMQENTEVINPGTLSVTVTDADGCVGSNSLEIDELDSLQPIVTGDLAYCEGTSTMIEGDDGYATYMWSNGQMTQSIEVTQAGDYTLTVMDAAGCSGEVTVSVTENPLPQPIITGDDQFCEGNSANLEVQSGFATYMWSNGTDIETTTVSQGGIVSVLVTDVNACENTATFDVTQLSNPTPVIVGELGFCPNTSTSLATAQPYASYNWSTSGMTDSVIINIPGPVSVEVMDANGCIGTANADIEEYQTADPQIDGLLDFCPNTSTELSVVGLFETYQWSDGLNQTATIQVNQADDYSVTVTDNNGCETSASVTTSIFVVTAPQITGSTEYCEGSSTMLDGGSGYASYEWSNMDDTQEVEITTPGEFTLSVTDNNGCPSEATIQIVENPLPQVDISGSSTFCAGGSTTLDAGSGFVSYEWSDNSQGQTLEVTAPGMISVLVTDGNGCQNTAVIDVEENTELSITIDGDLGICPGESTVLSPGTFATYQWSDSSTEPTLTTDQSGIYNVTVTDGDGCIGTGMVEVIGFDAPTPQILGDIDFCADEMTTLSLNQSFESYTWSTNENTASIETNQAGTYAVEVMDINGCTASTSVDVQVFDLPIVEIAGDDQYCAGDASTLSVTGTFASYLWSNGDMTSNTTADMPGLYEVVVSSDEGCESSASIQVDEIPLPISDAGVLQTIDCDNPSVSIGGQNTPQGDYEYTWTGPGITPDNQNEYQPVVDSGGVYTLVVEDVLNGCISEVSEVQVEDLRYDPVVVLEVLDVLDCVTSSVLINSDGSTYGSDIAYQWQDAGGTIMSNDQNYVATQPGIVVLMIVDEVTGCMALDSILIEENEDYPIVIAGDDQEIDCDTPEASLDGSASQSSINIVYQWTAQNGGNIISDDTQPTITVDAVGTYVLMATDTTNGCNNEDIVEVLGDFVPPLAEAGMSQTLDCNNPTVVIDGTGSSIGSNITYQWQNPSGETVSENLSFDADAIGVYQLIVTDNQNGCTAEDIVEVFQVEDELNSFDVDWEIPTCFGDDDGSISISGIEGGEGPYLYSINGGAFSSMPNFNGLLAGAYAIIVQDANGCEVETEITIEDGNDLQVNLGDDQTINLGETVTVDGNVTVDRGDLQEIIWKVTGDTLGCEDCIVFDASPMVTSEYILTVVDSNGCVATDDLTIFVDARDDIFVPTAFSPNGDGNNDKFTIYAGDDVVEIRSFQVFNRWGEVMHEVFGIAANDEDFGWNGEYRGQLQNTGVFVYMAEIEFIDGTVKLYKGDVLLMR